MAVITIVSDVTPCDLVDYRSLGGSHYFHLQIRSVRHAAGKKDVTKGALVVGCLLD
jgi:hypothetical protein